MSLFLCPRWRNKSDLFIYFIIDLMKFCVLYKIRSKPNLCGALPVHFLPVWVTCGALVTHWYSFSQPSAVPHSTTRLIYLTQYLYGNDLGDSMFDGMGLVGLNSRVDFLLAWGSLSLFVFHCFIFLFLPSVVLVSSTGCIYSLSSMQCLYLKIIIIVQICINQDLL